MTADALPLEAARSGLARALAARAAAAGLPAPEVAALGNRDALGPEPAASARPRSAATVHLTSSAVLVGPWGGAPDSPPPAAVAWRCGGSGCAAGPNARPWRRGSAARRWTLAGPGRPRG